MVDTILSNKQDMIILSARIQAFYPKSLCFPVIQNLKYLLNPHPAQSGRVNFEARPSMRNGRIIRVQPVTAMFGENRII